MLAAVGLVAGVLAVGVVAVRSGPDPRPSTTAAPPEPGPASADALRGVVADLSAFVEGVRGLRFLRPVEVELLDGSAFEERLLAEQGEVRREVEATGRVLQALELMADDVDLAAAVESYLGDAVLGFYDAPTGALVVRGAQTTAYVKTVLVHELTHALDDQHFDLDRPELDDAEDESAAAFSALAEGDAVRVEQLYLRSLDEDERGRAVAEQRAFGRSIEVPDLPPFVVQLIGFPYIAGPPFVDALVERGGERLVDTTFGAPPTTTESILRPDRFLAREAQVDVTPPAAEGQVFDHGVMGAWAITTILGDAVGSEQARQAVEGWAGDAYVAWSSGGRTCVRASFVMDSGEAGVLADAWTTWGEGHPDARVGTAGNQVHLTACR